MPNIYRPFPGDITKVHGIRVGQAQNEEALTGVTVVMAPAQGAAGGVSVRGAAPGTRETDLLKPGNLVEAAHAVVLAGGSAYGLAAADGVMKYLEQMGVGIEMGGQRVPIVPAAVLYDLGVGDGAVRPDAACARFRISDPALRGEALLEDVCRGRGFLMKGGVCDYDRCCSVVLDEFRGGKVGKITIERA